MLEARGDNEQLIPSQDPWLEIGFERIILPLLAFGAGAADGFAYLVLGGIFTANMTGNVILATMFYQPGSKLLLAGALTALGSFALALIAGFRITRAQPSCAFRRALVTSGLFQMLVAILWWLAPDHVFILIAASASAMALQTVAAKRDGIDGGATTTYVTGTLTDLLKDIVDGDASWTSHRWLSLFALPMGALASVAIARAWPALAPLAPLGATAICILLISLRDGRGSRSSRL